MTPKSQPLGMILKKSKPRVGHLRSLSLWLRILCYTLRVGTYSISPNGTIAPQCAILVVSSVHQTNVCIRRLVHNISLNCVIQITIIVDVNMLFEGNIRNMSCSSPTHFVIIKSKCCRMVRPL